ncbi:hypothetical protein Calni_1145 [Calditerrivibrio nitroreducens DSM 19672]|uniref:Uncharacterized protein n=1 Tax=Calditerrivibrio nitroreducens (strain DSM 19672 / NBRC 101217 / Yu37-1) TaxID=768670 RepID=E4TIK8_CALNY|nr:hypothetical protein Calni_1145 [Calditerrivibrio nitroreducens DSM 19672]
MLKVYLFNFNAVLIKIYQIITKTTNAIKPFSTNTVKKAFAAKLRLLITFFLEMSPIIATFFRTKN